MARARASSGDGLLEALQEAGAQVQTARSAQEAIDAFQADPPNIVIGELDETEARDHKVIRGIRALRTGRDVPAIVVSELPWEEHRSAALKAGFSQWISQPAGEAIIEVVTTLLRRDAEVVARPLAAGSSGRSLLTDITTTPVPEIIRYLWRSRRSGDLLVRARRTIKMIFFDRGRIVFAASNVRKERLGEVLMALGTISGDEFHLASRLMADRKVRFGDALVAAGVMQKGAVTTSVTRWVEKVVLSLFELNVGSASFEDRPCPIPPDYRVDLQPMRIVYQGARAIKDIERVRTALGNLDRCLTYSGEPDFPIEPADVGVLELAKAPVTIRRLAWGAKALDAERLRGVYGLMAAGVLRDPKEASEPATATAPAILAAPAAPVTPAAPVARVAPAAPVAPKSDPHAEVRREVREEMTRSEAMDHVTWLGIPSGAAPAAIVDALEKRQMRYEALQAAAGSDPELKTDLELLTGRVLMAQRMARRKLEVAAPAPAPAPEPTPPPPAAASATSSMEIEHLLLEASIKMSVSDFADAARTYGRVVDLAPDVAEYRVRLAMAMARSSRTARQAEAQFQEAIRLDPGNAELHYQLGIYYKAMKVRSRSITELREALRLDPGHQKAREELA